jgi:diguanylate cyclase (GGDEF)-like protein
LKHHGARLAFHVLYTALLVYDDAASPSAVAPALAQIGCELVCANAPHAPDLVVVDVAEAAATCARLSARYRGVPILALAEPEDIASLFEAGATDCVARPVRHVELVARARAVLRADAERSRHVKRERRLSETLRKLELEKQELEKIACVDSLTGIANRRHALALLDAEWKRSARDGTPISLVMIDIDCFHAFNECYGHVGGDECLRRVSAAMVGCLRRPSDFVGRYGGEEFVAVLANTDAVGARLVAERLRAAVEALAIEHAGSTCAKVVTISAGFATAQARPEAVAADLLSTADHALLTAKAQGKNRALGDGPPAPPRPYGPQQPWVRFPVVVADPWFADRIPAFLASRRDDASALAAACSARTFDRVRSIARRMRAAAVEHGFERIQRLAGVLEHAARDEDSGTLAAAIDELVLYVDHVQVTYRRPLDQSA